MIKPRVRNETYSIFIIILDKIRVLWSLRARERSCVGPTLRIYDVLHANGPTSCLFVHIVCVTFMVCIKSNIFNMKT